jgi:hypothetical protein
VGWRSTTSFSPTTRYGWFLAVVVQVLSPSLDIGVGGDWAGAKAPHFADDGDACGRRSLLGGVVMASIALPATSARGNPRSSSGSSDGGTMVSFPPWRRRVGCSWCRRVHNCYLERESQGRNVHLVGVPGRCLSSSWSDSAGHWLFSSWHYEVDGTLICVS